MVAFLMGAGPSREVLLPSRQGLGLSGLGGAGRKFSKQDPGGEGVSEAVLRNIKKGHMSIRRNSLYNSMPWTISGVLSLFGVLAYDTRKGIAFGGFSQNTVMVTSQIEGYRFWGGPIAFGAFCVILTSHDIPPLRA